jgi:AraC family transcriptional regulator, transcriptional activator of the genes for pyochelin and ferripyochelin receptors
MEEKTTREFENGIITSTKWHCDGIIVGHAHSRFKEKTSFTASSNLDVVRLHFGMKGNYSFSYKQLNKTFDLIGSHHNIMYSKGFDMVVENKTLELETFGIHFPTDIFLQYTQHASDHVKRFSEAVLKGENIMLSEKWGAIEPGLHQVIQQIINCKFTGDVKKIFLLSKSVELLVLSAEAYNNSLNRTQPFIKSKSDKEKLIAVRDLIIERANRPPNLSEIAKTVGLNEYKLKRGFKEIFNTTVFGYLTEQRLHMARQFLYDTRKTAAEISADLGYATPQHFNNAFKKKFGVTPYSVRNNP